MDKGLLLRITEKAKEKGLKSRATELVASKTPKTVFISLITWVPYELLRHMTKYPSVTDVVRHFYHDGPYPVYLTADDAVRKLLHLVNWGLGRTRRSNVIMVLEVKTEAVEGYYGELRVPARLSVRPPIPVSALAVPVEKSEYDMYYIDQDMIEDSE